LVSHKGNVANACQVDGYYLFLPLFWDESESIPCYRWALRNRIYQWCQCLSSGRQAIFSSPCIPWKFVQRRKIKTREWPWHLSYNCHVWMQSVKSDELFTSRGVCKIENFELFENVNFWRPFFLKSSIFLRTEIDNLPSNFTGNTM
jgi:hypothetical protein